MATIKEVKEQLATLTDLDDHRWTSFEEDSRAGVQTAIKQRRKAILAEIAEEERLEKMLSYEKALYAQGVELIAGVDEVGRGPLAGPVVAAAVILPKLCKIKGLNDRGVKIIISSHDMNLIYEICDYVYVLNQGVLINEGTREEVFINEEKIDEAGLELPWLVKLHKNMGLPLFTREEDLYSYWNHREQKTV